MKKTLLLGIAFATFSLASHKTIAQNLQTLSIQSGFNSDVIANGIGPSSQSTSTDVDGVSFVFVSRDFQLTSGSDPLAFGLPEDGIVNSVVASTSGLAYQLAPYDSDNSLRLENLGDSGTLVFANPIPAVTVYMLATGGSGDCTVDATINFADNTSETISGLFINDWYGGNDYAIRGIGRINTANDVLEDGGGTNPRLYQIPLMISTDNQSKAILSITVTKSDTGGIPNIFAFSADAYTSCPAPSNITFTSASDGGTFNWTAPSAAPSAGYQYYYSSSPNPPSATTPPTGNVGEGVTTLTLTGLAMGQTYYLWVRSNCGSEQGFWQLKTFTTGQMEVVYTTGDIDTEYADDPEVSSTTECPGSLTINIPAGFQIASTNVEYAMTTASNGWLNEQRSILECANNNTSEDAVASGVGSNTGTYNYNRNGLTLANGLTGAVSFNLKAWRTYGSSGCNVDYNRVVNNSWKITVTLTADLSNTEATAQKIRVYPIPFNNVLNIDNPQQVKTVAVTDLTGKLVYSTQQPQQQLYLGGLTNGLYLLTLTTEDGSLQHTKVLKQ